MKFANRGFTLIEVMVVAGLLSGLSLVFVELTKQTSKSSTKFQYDTELTFIYKEITGILAKPNNCLATFNPTGTANVLSPTRIIDIVAGVQIDKFLTIGGGAPAQGYGNAKVEINSYTLAIDPYPSTDGKLTIKYKNKNILGNPTEIEKFIGLNVERDAAVPHYITNCSPTGSSAFSDIWSKVPLTFFDIYYNSGNVGIGTSSPTTLLEVNGTVKGTTFNGTSYTSINPQAQSTTDGASAYTGNSGAILLDDSGQKRISWNDGAGNLNLRSGNYHNGTSLVYQKGAADANGGAATITLTSDTAAGKILGSVAPIGVPGVVVPYSNSFSLEDQIGFIVSTGVGAAVERMRVDTAGNVGIGTNNPQTKLDVDGSIKVADESTVLDPACNSNTEGSMRYHSGSKIMQYCALIGASYVWTAFGSNEGINVCPAGMNMMGSAGKRSAYCIENNKRSGNYATAITTCNALNDANAGRAHLCTFEELFNACTIGGISDLPNNSSEIVAIPPGGPAFPADQSSTVLFIPSIYAPPGFSGCIRSNYQMASSALSYRCCVR